MYELQIRLVTTKKGLELFKNNVFLQPLFKNPTIHKTFGDIVYLGWEKATLSKGYSIKDAMLNLEKNDISYTLSIQDKSFEGTIKCHYNSKNSKVKELPFPSIVHTFDEKDMEEQLKGFKNYLENNKLLEDIDYE